MWVQHSRGSYRNTNRSADATDWLLAGLGSLALSSGPAWIRWQLLRCPGFSPWCLAQPCTKHPLGRDLRAPACPSGLGSAGAGSESWCLRLKRGGGAGAAGNSSGWAGRSRRGGDGRLAAGTEQGAGPEPFSPLVWRPAVASGDG